MEWYEYLIAGAAALGFLLLFCIWIFGVEALGRRKHERHDRSITDRKGKAKSEEDNGRF